MNKGIIPAIVTPLAKNGTFRADNFRLHLGTPKDDGGNGVVDLETTGEGPSMSFDERKRIITTAVDVPKDIVVLTSLGALACGIHCHSLSMRLKFEHDLLLDSRTISLG